MKSYEYTTIKNEDFMRYILSPYCEKLSQKLTFKNLTLT